MRTPVTPVTPVTAVTAALAAALSFTLPAYAAKDADLAEIRARSNR